MINSLFVCTEWTRWQLSLDLVKDHLNYFPCCLNASTPHLPCRNCEEKRETSVEVNAVASMILFIEAVLYFMSLFCLCLVMAVGFYIYWYQLRLVFFLIKQISIVKWPCVQGESFVVPVNLEKFFSGKEDLTNLFLLYFWILGFIFFLLHHLGLFFHVVSYLGVFYTILHVI